MPIVPIARAKLRALRALAYVVQQFDVRRAPAQRPSQADARVEARLARIEARGAGRATVVREALKAIGNEGIEAPVRSLELDPEARAVQIRVLTLIEVKRQVVRAALGAAIGRALEAKEVADRRAVDRQRVDEWIALRASGAAGERSYHQGQEACGVDWAHRRHGVPLYFYARLS